MPPPVPSPADHAAAPAAGSLEWARAIAVRQVEVLGLLADAGLEVALAIRDEIRERRAGADGASAPAEAAPEAAPPAPTPADVLSAPLPAHASHRDRIAFARVARAVRLALMLQDRLVKDVLAMDSGALVEREARLKGRRTDLQRLVRRVAEGEGRDGVELAMIESRVRNRLERDDIYGDLLARPVSELLAIICKDCDLAPDWLHLAQEAWAREELAGGAPGLPLKSLADCDTEPDPWPFPLGGEVSRCAKHE